MLWWSYKLIYLPKLIVCSFGETQTGNSKTINNLWSDGLIIPKIALSSEEIELERAGGLER